MLLEGVYWLCIFCDTVPQTKRSVIECCYQLVFIGQEILLSEGWKNVVLLLRTKRLETKLVAKLLLI